MLAGYLVLHLFLLILGLYLVIRYPNPIIIILFLIYLIVFLHTIILTSYMTAKAFHLIGTGNYSIFQDMARALYHKFLNVEYIDDSRTDHLPHNVIYVANYPADAIEYFSFGLFDNIIVVAKDTKDVRWGGGLLSGIIFQKGKYIPVGSDESNYDQIKEQIRNHIKTKSIFVYPEIISTRRHIYELCPFRSGIFRISRELKIPIVPLVIDHIKYGQGGLIDRNQKLKIHIGKSYFIQDDNSIKEIHSWMASKLQSLR